MNDRPIIFSGMMIRALLAHHKRMTRRILKPQPDTFVRDDGKECDVGVMHIADEPHARITVGRVITRQKSPYAIGDCLWVRETVACGACASSKPSHWAPSFWRREQGTSKNPNGIWYAADGLSPERLITDRGRWRPAIHMPRWCSRLTLVVTGVKIERLQNISEEDAEAEGAEPILVPPDGGSCPHIEGFIELWESIHGTGSWDKNPFVVAPTFEVHHCNIDKLTKAAA